MSCREARRRRVVALELEHTPFVLYVVPNSEFRIPKVSLPQGRRARADEGGAAAAVRRGEGPHSGVVRPRALALGARGIGEEPAASLLIDAG